MHFSLYLLTLTAALASAAPSRVSKRASTCTFTSAASASESKKSCSSIVLKDIEVPAGETLDLSDLEDGTKVPYPLLISIGRLSPTAQVTFEGTTTFGYKEWEGPLIRVSGSDITVTGSEGHLIDGEGSRWWDGEGNNGGKTKPKLFYAHSLDDSTISGLNVKNTPVNAFSIQSDNLVLDGIVFDDSDGDSNGGHNTDAFNVGESTYITIKNANVKNQDDCLAINSGEVRTLPPSQSNHTS